MGQGMRTCNGNFAVLVQPCPEGKWSHVLGGPVIAPGAHCGTAPFSAGRDGVSAEKTLGGQGFLERGTLSSEMNQKRCECGGPLGRQSGGAKRE